MPEINFRKVLLPFLTVFLLLLVHGIIIGRTDDHPFLYRDVGSVQIPPFRTMDLQGNTVTQDIFMGNFTVVCLWVTQDADNSRKLLTSINDWRNSAPAAFQLIGMIGDLKDASDAARIAAASSVAGAMPAVPQLFVNDDLADLLARIRNAPTVFFVDKSGNLVGQPVVGNEPILVRKEAMRLIEAESEEGKVQKELQNILFRRP